MIQNDFDVMIIGGGLVGLTFANILARDSFKVAIFDNEMLDLVPISNQLQLRVSAINHASYQILNHLNIWQTLPNDRISAYEKMCVWDFEGKNEIHFDCVEVGKSNLGYIIENQLLQNSLLQKLQGHENVTIFSGVEPHHIIENRHQVILQLKNNQQFTARLLVGADGPHSWVRNETHIKSFSWPYQHVALVTTVETELPLRKTAWQCFYQQGVLALLPFASSHHASIVWSLLPDEADRIFHYDDVKFTTEINRVSEGRLGTIKKLDRIIKFPLVMRHAKDYIKSRIALIGDSAHTIHPLAGQGVNLGLLDAACLAEVISFAHAHRHDFGIFLSLRRYERWRKGDNWLMIAAMEIFKRLFAAHSPAIVKTRNLGLRFTDHNKYLKNQFIHHALGVKEDLPQLAREQF